MPIHVAVIGGGTGNFSILSGLKLYKPLELSAIVSMMDDGGSTGRLRSEYGILPPGDVRQCMVALSEETALIQKLFQHRLLGSLGDHNFGNLFHLALSQITGSEERAILEMSRILKISGTVLPVTLEQTCLNAELEDGTIVTGETNIDLPKHDPNLSIVRLFLEPAAKANPLALRAIEQADYIIISPGDLFTSTLPNFLVSGIARQIISAHAKRIYVCNLMTKPGETTGFNASDHVRLIHEYLGEPCLDIVIVNRTPLSPDTILEYRAQDSFPVVHDTAAILAAGAKQVIEADVINRKSLIRHDPFKIAWELFKIIQEDQANLNPAS